MANCYTCATFEAYLRFLLASQPVAAQSLTSEIPRVAVSIAVVAVAAGI